MSEETCMEESHLAMEEHFNLFEVRLLALSPNDIIHAVI